MAADKTPARRGILGIWRAGRRPGMKAILVALLALLLAVPMFYVANVIHERSARAMSVRQEIAADWGGGAQDIISPLLVVPMIERRTTIKRLPGGGEEETRTELRRFAVFAPETLNVDAALDLRRLKKGIYALHGYEGELELSGSFAPPDPRPFAGGDTEILWDQSYVSLPVSHPRGIKDLDRLSWGADSRSSTFLPRARDNGISQTGVHAPVALAEGTGPVPFRLRMVMRGSERLRVLPLGGRTEVTLASKSIAAEAIGGSTPAEFDSGATHSRGHWRIDGVNLDLPRAWEAGGDSQPGRYKTEEAAVGMAFPVPTDYYGKVTRVSRYAPFFIGLTFLVVFLLEVLTRRQFHVVQYYMVGGSLAVFYVLLLALAEQIEFTFAYIIAASLTVVILSVYGMRLARSARVFLYFLPALAAVYGALYAFLEMEDQALLIASAVMLAGLTASMILTPRIAWYGDEEP